MATTLVSINLTQTLHQNIGNTFPWGFEPKYKRTVHNYTMIEPTIVKFPLNIILAYTILAPTTYQQQVLNYPWIYKAQ